ncbi:unnamed protein product [Eruca vesicaria subsp. sativa]|uniref:Pirin-like protein n=1 Tax=Eruca vesicaria subsp. sativa TaxID=29727 RepID=A0ABC8J654_ERUVS|nr:unnamed protein product [Eruca vesicaria subsp. sativa]
MKAAINIANTLRGLVTFGFIRNIKSMSSSSSSSQNFVSRSVIKKVFAKLQKEGDGAVVRRGISRSEQKLLDPFLMLDEFSVSPPAGFPDHPHRGFETVTEELLIKISKATRVQSNIYAGDVQWMTAGRGIIHSEMPEEEVNKGLQLWINLSSSEKMIEPNYQELSSADIPKAEQNGVQVKVIAGESMGIQSPVYTRTPTMFLDFTLGPGAQFHQNVPESWNVFAYVLESGEGGAVFGSSNSSPVSAHNVVVFGQGNDGVSVWNKSSSKILRFVLIAGEPIGEPVVQYGPFVMNTQAEIDMTIEDYHYSKNGFEMAKYWKSQ